MTAANPYREWRAEQNLPPMRFLLIFSALAWTVVPSFNDYFYPGDLPEIVYWVCLTVHLPLCLAGLALSRSAWRRHLDLYMSALILLTGFNQLWATAEVFDSVGGVAVVGVWYALLCPFVRLPLRNVICVAVPIIATAELWILLHFELSLAQAFTELGFLGLALCLAIPFGRMDERWLRFAYKQKLLLAEQQAALERRHKETEESRNLIRRYVPLAVAESIIAGREADIAELQRRRVTVLFSDIAGFTDVADRVEPEVMSQVLNEYLSSMVDLVESHGGTLNEFAGDGLMALFGAPEAIAPEEQVRSAVAAAKAMQAKMPELNEQWRKLGLGTELQIRIGINTGMVSVGSYGSQGRMTYTAIGLQTNIASRIESQAAPGEILLSDASYQLISDQIACEPRGEVECKGVHFPVKVYAPAVPTSLRGTQ